MARPRPRLIAITDTRVAGPDALLARAAALCTGGDEGSVMIQLRDRELPVRARLALGEQLVAITRRTGQLFAVNDRADLALLLGADALHLGEHSVDVASARAVVGAGMWISRAAHDVAACASAGADAVVIAPVLEARKGRPALGLDGLSRARERVGHGVLLYALGGIDAARAGDCLAAGADGVAAIGAVFAAPSVEPLLSALGCWSSARQEAILPRR